MGKKKNQSVGYQTAVGGGKKVLRLLIYILIIIAIAFLGKTSYHFGYEVFHQQPMASAIRARDVEIVILEDMSVYQIGELLESKGLIEDPMIFVVQELLSDYHGQIQSGRHTLSTAQTPDEMLEVLASSHEEEEE